MPPSSPASSVSAQFPPTGSVVPLLGYAADWSYILQVISAPLKRTIDVLPIGMPTKGWVVSAPNPTTMNVGDIGLLWQHTDVTEDLEAVEGDLDLTGRFTTQISRAAPLMDEPHLNRVRITKIIQPRKDSKYHLPRVSFELIPVDETTPPEFEAQLTALRRCLSHLARGAGAGDWIAISPTDRLSTLMCEFLEYTRMDHHTLNEFLLCTGSPSEQMALAVKGVTDYVSSFLESTAYPDEIKAAIEILPLPTMIRDRLRALFSASRGDSETTGQGVKIARDVLRIYSTPIKPIKTDLKQASTIFSSSHYGLREVKDSVLDVITRVLWLQQCGRPQSLGSSTLCLVGDPGTGKTTIAESVARALDRELITIPLAACTSVFLAGAAWEFRNSRPGEVVRSLANNKLNPHNVVFLLDEIDKISSRAEYSPLPALLSLLDPSQQTQWRDQFLNDIPIDLSGAVFFATANYEQNILPPLLDRMKVLHIRPYTSEEKWQITKQYLIPKILNKLHAQNVIAFSPSSIDALIELAPDTSGCRWLEQSVETLISRGLRSHMETKQPIRIDYEATKRYLTRGKSLQKSLLTSPVDLIN